VRWMSGLLLLALGGCSTSDKKPLDLNPECPVSLSQGCCPCGGNECACEAGSCAPYVCQPIGDCGAGDLDTACACLEETVCGYGFGECREEDGGTVVVTCRTE
jgi:hypothetical protein